MLSSAYDTIYSAYLSFAYSSSSCKAKDNVYNLTMANEVNRVLHDVTYNDDNKADAKKVQWLVEQTYNGDELTAIVTFVRARLDDAPVSWRKIVKTLRLIYQAVLLGHTNFYTEMQQELFKITALQQLQYAENNSDMCGECKLTKLTIVRDVATDVCSILTNPQRFEQEKQRALAFKKQMSYYDQPPVQQQNAPSQNSWAPSSPWPLSGAPAGYQGYQDAPYKQEEVGNVGNIYKNIGKIATGATGMVTGSVSGALGYLGYGQNQERVPDLGNEQPLNSNYEAPTSYGNSNNNQTWGPPSSLKVSHTTTTTTTVVTHKTGKRNSSSSSERSSSSDSSDSESEKKKKKAKKNKQKGGKKPKQQNEKPLAITNAPYTQAQQQNQPSKLIPAQSPDKLMELNANQPQASSAFGFLCGQQECNDITSMLQGSSGPSISNIMDLQYQYNQSPQKQGSLFSGLEVKPAPTLQTQKPKDELVTKLVNLENIQMTQQQKQELERQRLQQIENSKQAPISQRQDVFVAKQSGFQPMMMQGQQSSLPMGLNALNYLPNGMVPQQQQPQMMSIGYGQQQQWQQQQQQRPQQQPSQPKPFSGFD